jgi:hypothetical protein
MGEPECAPLEALQDPVRETEVQHRGNRIAVTDNGLSIVFGWERPR